MPFLNKHCSTSSKLNVLVTVQGESYLVDVVPLAVCNHSTFSQGILKSVTDLEFSI